MKNLKVKRKQFFFGKYNNFAYIYIRRSHTNIFITLTDLRRKVIICKSAGSCVISNSKRKKVSPQAIEAIVGSLSIYLKLYRIKYLEIFVSSKMYVYLYFLIKELTFLGIIIKRFHMCLHIPHNGVRSRKLRRV